MTFTSELNWTLSLLLWTGACCRTWNKIYVAALVFTSLHYSPFHIAIFDRFFYFFSNLENWKSDEGTQGIPSLSLFLLWNFLLHNTCYTERRWRILRLASICRLRKCANLRFVPFSSIYSPLLPSSLCLSSFPLCFSPPSLPFPFHSIECSSSSQCDSSRA